MNTNTDLHQLDPDSLSENEEKAAMLIQELQKTLAGKVSSRRDLHQATQLLFSLESLGINTEASLVYQEMDRLRRVWKKRLRAQDDIDRWMIEHGHPPY